MFLLGLGTKSVLVLFKKDHVWLRNTCFIHHKHAWSPDFLSMKSGFCHLRLDCTSYRNHQVFVAQRRLETILRFLQKHLILSPQTQLEMLRLPIKTVQICHNKRNDYNLMDPLQKYLVINVCFIWWQHCANVLLRYKHMKRLVRVRKTSCFTNTAELPFKNTSFLLHKHS